MRKPPVTKIDHNLCVGCGLCVQVCPSDTLAVEDGKCVVTGVESMRCAQCVAVCPEGAVSLDGIDVSRPKILGENPGTADLVSLMMFRRSCRNYTKESVDRKLLEDLVIAGTWAPSGTNSQEWSFTIIPDRPSMLVFADSVADFYRKINRMAQSKMNRLAARIFMGDALGKYYREYYETVKSALEGWEENGRDRLFHGATSAIIVSTGPDASCPVEDTMMASQNIALAAEAAKLGSCLIGFAVEAMAREPKIGITLGIPPNEKVRSVIALGHPAVNYLRPSGRMAVTPRYFVSKKPRTSENDNEKPINAIRK